MKNFSFNFCMLPMITYSRNSLMYIKITFVAKTKFLWSVSLIRFLKTQMHVRNLGNSYLMKNTGKIDLSGCLRNHFQVNRRFKGGLFRRNS